MGSRVIHSWADWGIRIHIPKLTKSSHWVVWQVKGHIDMVDLDEWPWHESWPTPPPLHDPLEIFFP